MGREMGLFVIPNHMVDQMSFSVCTHPVLQSCPLCDSTSSRLTLTTTGCALENRILKVEKAIQSKGPEKLTLSMNRTLVNTDVMWHRQFDAVESDYIN